MALSSSHHQKITPTVCGTCEWYWIVNGDTDDADSSVFPSGTTDQKIQGPPKHVKELPSGFLWPERIAHYRRIRGRTPPTICYCRATGDIRIQHLEQDELIYIWDLMTGDLLQTLKGHTGTIYTTTWNPHQSLLARCVLL